MTLKKEIIVLGDIEMGAGNLTDDFISDKALAELISELSRRSHPMDLVLNGDTFDFLKCPYFVKNKLTYPRHITDEISLNKLNLIYRAHEKVFLALKKFVRKKNNQLYFLIGNHDPDLVHKKIQEKVRILLGNPKRIHFGLKYKEHNVYVEHGQQYDILTKINFNRLFLDYGEKQILNLSYVSFGLISQFMELKEEHPFMERIFPRDLLFSLHKKVIKKVTRRSVDYLLKSALYYPLRYYFDPTYTYPREMFREFYRRLHHIHWDINEIISVFKRKRRRSLNENKIYVLGHVHEKYIEDKEGTAIIHPGSWRDEYDLNLENRKLIPRPKRYVQIIVADEGTEYQVIEVPIKRSQFDFDQVINNELKYVKIAAEEEKFILTLI